LEDKTPEITDGEKRAAVDYLRTHWNRRYGLVEVG
jgi:hypothetical protein